MPMTVQPPEAPAPFLRQLPPWLDSVKGVSGEIAVVCLNPAKLEHLTQHLTRERIDFWRPLQQIVRCYGRQRKSWSRSIFPGRFFIGRGDEGRTVVSEYCDYFGWNRKFIRTPQNASAQAELRQEIESLELALGVDPMLSAREGFIIGRKVKVVAGPFEGAWGIITQFAARVRVCIVVNILGQNVPLEVPAEQLEAA